jgi:TrmH family RNA methyltransferase
MVGSSPHFPVTGKDNSHIKYLRSLSDARTRRSKKVFLIEGVKMVEEALRDSLGVKLVIATPSLTRHQGRGVIKLAEQAGCDLLWISDRLMDSVAESKTPQPVLAVVEMRERSDQSLMDDPAGLIVLCHHLQDPGNLGAIIRTAEAALAAGVAVAANTVDPYNAKCVRATMGSILRMPVVRLTDSGDFLRSCRRRGFQTAALVLSGARRLFDLDLRKPTVMVLGQEGSGLPDQLLAEVDLRVRIPMADTVESLNVAASAAVVLYEAMRQRGSTAR